VHKVGRLKVYCILLLALFVQLTVMNRFRFFGARPDLMAICVAFFGLFFARSAGFETGVAAGALTDLFSLDYFGINMCVYGITGLLAGSLQSSFVKESKRSQFLLVFFCTAFSMSLHFCLVSVFSRSVSFGFSDYFRACIVPVCLYTAIVSIPVFIKFIELFHLKEQDDLL
jgi:rod shape-determining protein MreD